MRCQEILKVLNITDQQQRYLTDHLGHTLDVHRVFYRSTSDLIERLDLAKILMLLDNCKIGKYRGQNVADITMEDILDVSLENEECGTVTAPEKVTEEDYYPDMPDCEDVDETARGGKILQDEESMQGTA
ncbi:uncharacterized protein [Diadema antillarum]|uniref:uncharacterized protein n=1 Tax=Diadema antillarum TaxID=105358 RepID=UPI003A8B40AE